MNKLLITGFSGFVSFHYLNFLEESNIVTEIIGIDRNKPSFGFKGFNNISCSFLQIGLLNSQELTDLIKSFSPNEILHLASLSSVSKSWKYPAESFLNNTNIFLNVLEAVRVQKLNVKILSIGSSEVYGQVNKPDLPLRENTSVNPVSPYAVARVSQEMLSKVYVNAFNLDIISTRSFNHIGTHQNKNFVIPSFANQVIKTNNGPSNKKTIVTGDLSIIRVFVDVRDVVRAYYLLLKYGVKGEVYNICGEAGFSLSQIIEKMATIEGVKYNLEIDPKLIRPNDNPIIIGSYKKINNLCGWKPLINIDQSLSDILDYWKKK